MTNAGYKKLNMELIAKKSSKTVSSSEALRDVVPVEWSDDVISGKSKVILGVPEKEKVCADKSARKHRAYH